MRKHKYAQKQTKVIIAINWLNNIPNVASKLITNKNTILISAIKHNLLSSTKQKQRERK